jgi:tetratricopeptide (TPR) repeat protein
MRKLVYFVLFAALVLPVGVVAQTSQFAEYETDHFRVLSEIGEEHAEQTAKKLESLLVLFNDYFHFDLDELPVSLRARFFNTKADYDTYLRRVIDQTRDDFVYLHYTDLAKSELVGFAVEDEDEFDVSLKHQGFIQFLRAFVPNPPLWMREGFAVFFEEVGFNDDFTVAEYRENLSWLETVQAAIDGTVMVEPIQLEDMLTITVAEARERIDVFYPQAWGMVSFLLNSENREVNRIMWDSISSLDTEATLSENSVAVYEKAFTWEAESFLVDAFFSYLSNRRSFRTLVQDGIDSYSEGSLDVAEASFNDALLLREDNFIPFYYLGLINYDRQNYSLSDFYYKEALDKGSTEALTYYALGVNAYADNRFEDAISYLEQTIRLDPAAYQDKANQLLERIEG